MGATPKIVVDTKNLSTEISPNMDTLALFEGSGLFVGAEQFGPPLPTRAQLKAMIKERFSDGQWHAPKEMPEAIGGADTDGAGKILREMSVKKIYLTEANVKKVGPGVHYQIYDMQKRVSAQELTEKLTPLVKQLKQQGHDHMAHWSPAIIAGCASQLKKLLDEW